jgi:FkbM family methyltransferase
MKIAYGIANNNIDVTQICFEKLIQQGIIKIPSGDSNRATFFSDPLEGILKSVFVTINNNVVEYDHTKTIYIDINRNAVYTQENVPAYIIPNIQAKLANIHSQLNIDYGSFNEEYPEQMMATRYLTGKENVLEIGGNIGRNTLVISYILAQQHNYNFVSLECDPNIANQLRHNKEINSLQFQVENAALSKRKLIQQGWNTVASDTVLDGWTAVNTITWEDLEKKYNIQFDTLVLDCEGAFYYILMDMPEILKNVNLIIMENDYNDIAHKNYIDTILKQHNFYVDYVEAGGWGCCFNNFFEVWKRK